MAFSGMAYPLVYSPKGYFPVTKGTNLIKGDLLNLLLTKPGERVMMPQYGTPLDQLLFDPNDAFLAEKARSIIVNSISKWEPRIKIDAININSGIDQNSRSFLNSNDDLTEAQSVLGIQILFRDPQDIQEIQELVLQVPLQVESK